MELCKNCGKKHADMEKCYKSEAVAKSYAQMKQDELNKAKIIAGPGNKEEPGKVLADLPTDSPSEPKGQLKVAQPGSVTEMAHKEIPQTTERGFRHKKQLRAAEEAFDFDYKGDLGSRMRNGTTHWKAKDHLKIAEGLRERAKDPSRAEALANREMAEAYEHEFLAQEKSKNKPKNKMNKSEPTLEKGIIKDAVLGAALTTTIAAAGIAHEQHNKAIDPHMTAPTPVEYDGNDPHIIVHSEEIHENKAKKIEALRQKLTEMRNAKPQELAKPCVHCGGKHGVTEMEKCNGSVMGKSFNQLKQEEMQKSELDKNLAVAPAAPSDGSSSNKPKAQAPMAPNPHLPPSKPAAPATHFDKPKEPKANKPLAKEENPDSKADAELGEKVEELVEQHMTENKEAEEKEGHKLTIQKGMSYSQLKEKEAK